MYYFGSSFIKIKHCLIVFCILVLLSWRWQLPGAWWLPQSFFYTKSCPSPNVPIWAIKIHQAALKTSQEEKVKLLVKLCDPVARLCLIFRIANIFSYILKIQNVFVLLNISSIKSVMIKSKIKFQCYLHFTLVWRGRGWMRRRSQTSTPWSLTTRKYGGNLTMTRRFVYSRIVESTTCNFIQQCKKILKTLSNLQFWTFDIRTMSADT